MAVLNFDIQLLQDACKALLTYKSMQEKFSKNCLQDLDSCGIESGKHRETIDNSKESLGKAFKEQSESIESAVRAIENATSDIEGFDMKQILNQNLETIEAAKGAVQVESKTMDMGV